MGQSTPIDQSCRQSWVALSAARLTRRGAWNPKDIASSVGILLSAGVIRRPEADLRDSYDMPVIDIQTHGRSSCTACFLPGSAPGSTRVEGAWRMDNNPGYWGAPEPEVLVLGFSKGANQSGSLPFDRIAFNGARHNLREILVALKLMPSNADIDAHFTATGRTFGFASVVRCGLGLEVEPGRYKTSGDVVRRAVEAGSPVRDVFDRCTERHLSRLPVSVRTVMFLGLDEPYIEAVFQRMSVIRPNLRRQGPMSYSDGVVTFVHVIHPSPLATSHRQNWLRNDGNALARKREEVVVALGSRTDNTGTQPSLSAEISPVVDVSAKLTSRSVQALLGGKTHRAASGKGHDLAARLRGLINAGTFAAREVGTPNRLGATNGKLLRLRREDGHEFAVDLTVAGCHIWTSVEPTPETPGLSAVEIYSDSRSRHSGLDVMPRLRGPNSKRGSQGVRACQAQFRTVE